MKKEFSTDAKVGLFVVIALIIIAYITIDVSNMSLTPGRTITIYTVLDNAEGIINKTPVQVAGIQVGVVSSVELLEGRRARIALKIKKGVRVTRDMEAQVRTRGVLGDKYIELIPGPVEGPPLKNGERLPKARRTTEYEDLFDTANEVTKNLKDITDALKTYTVSDQSVVAKILDHMETLTDKLATFSTNNAANMDAIVANLADLTADLKNLTRQSSGDLEATLGRIAEITDKINRGEGTVGRLINNEDTVDKANQVLDNLGDITHSYFSMQTEVGWHLEYLGRAGTAKNYVDFYIKPRPDKFFQFSVVHNPNPPGSTSFETEVFNTDGTVTTVQKETTTFDKVRFNAELGKEFDDFTIRGGLIESTGGFGVDYTKGPMVLKFDAYDFGHGNTHLKAYSELNLTRSLFVLGGVDNPTGQNGQADYFFGGGIRFTDADINSLFGGAALILGH